MFRLTGAVATTELFTFGNKRNYPMLIQLFVYSIYACISAAQQGKCTHGMKTNAVHDIRLDFYLNYS